MLNFFRIFERLKQNFFEKLEATIFNIRTIDSSSFDREDRMFRSCFSISLKHGDLALYTNSCFPRVTSRNRYSLHDRTVFQMTRALHSVSTI